MKMKKMIMILALCVPLFAQEAKDEVKEEVKKEVKECCQVSKQFSGDRGNRGFAVRAKLGQANKGRKKMHKKQQIKNVVRLAVIGGLAYYIGYHQGEKHFNGGMMKRRPSFGNKK
jgi:hypothetical protein